MKFTALLLIVLAFLASACKPAESASSAITPETATPADVSNVHTPEASAAPTPNDDEVFSQNGIRFEAPASLPGGILLNHESIVSPGGEAVPFIQISLGDDDAGSLRVYETGAFERVFGSFVFPPGSYGGGAAVIFTALEKPLSFQNGEGSRALEVHGQMAGYAANGSIKYVFRGTTSGGSQAVYLEYPVRIDYLPDANDIQASGGTAGFPVLTLAPDRSNYIECVESFNRFAKSELENRSGSEIVPSLIDLDRLVASLRIDVE